ncbi:MAG: 3-dehydroquinate synthase, partial [Gammaproteobacteria bacterium]|nr:3-dehydroquinate synthase [Gammaproteobacteria bacterium]
DLGDRSYPIYIGQQLLENQQFLTPHIKGNSVVIVSNTTVAPLYIDKIESTLKQQEIRYDSVILEDGEQYKTLESVNKIIDCLLTQRHDRKTTLIALGGGVIGDITGFAAAIYQRGVNFIQIPTTLLSQVDSSVGGKTGVNHPKGKNMIGAFYQPQCVIADISTFDTLPEREISAGLAEVIKYGLIYDEPFHCWLENNISALVSNDPEKMAKAVFRSCEIKAEVVAVDEKESGLRAILNLGHTFGHAIEATMGYGNWLHGEAVAVGMIMACDLSERLGWIDPTVKQRCIKLIEQANLPAKAPAEMSIDQYMQAMSIDKKVDNGTINFVLLTSLGKAVISSDYTQPLLEETLQSC